MVKHWLLQHPEAALLPEFRFRIVASFQDSLTRQIAESVRIDLRQGGVLNSKTEYSRCKLPRLMVDVEEWRKQRDIMMEVEQVREKRIVDKLREDETLLLNTGNGTQKRRSEEMNDGQHGTKRVRKKLKLEPLTEWGEHPVEEEVGMMKKWLKESLVEGLDRGSTRKVKQQKIIKYTLSEEELELLMVKEWVTGGLLDVVWTTLLERKEVEECTRAIELDQEDMIEDGARDEVPLPEEGGQDSANLKMKKDVKSQKKRLPSKRKLKELKLKNMLEGTMKLTDWLLVKEKIVVDPGGVPNLNVQVNGDEFGTAQLDVERGKRHAGTVHDDAECGTAQVVDVKKTESQNSDIQEGLDSKDTNDLIDRDQDMSLLAEVDMKMSGEVREQSLLIVLEHHDTRKQCSNIDAGKVVDKLGLIGIFKGVHDDDQCDVGEGGEQGDQVVVEEAASKPGSTELVHYEQLGGQGVLVDGECLVGGGDDQELGGLPGGVHGDAVTVQGLRGQQVEQGGLGHKQDDGGGQVQGGGVDEGGVQVPDRIVKQARRRRKKTMVELNQPLVLDYFQLKTAALHFGVKSVENLENLESKSKSERMGGPKSKKRKGSQMEGPKAKPKMPRMK